jgi:hypothetical protein
MQSSQTETVRAILSYLVEHEGAADTFEGIMRWWMMNAEINVRMERAREALVYLIGQGVLQERDLPGSDEKLYVVDLTKRDSLARLLG